MSSIEDKVIKLRAERVAREQARIQKLKELNMKKYANTLNIPNQQEKKPSTSETKVSAKIQDNKLKTQINKRPISVPVGNKFDYSNIKSKVVTKFVSVSGDNSAGTKSNINVTKNNKNCTKSVTKVTKIDKGIKSDNNGTKACPIKIEVKSNNEIAPNKSVNIQRSAKKVNNIDNKIPVGDSRISNKPDIVITAPSDDSESQNSDTNVINGKHTEKKTNIALPSKTALITTQNNTTNKSVNEKRVLTEITKRMSVNTKLFQKNDVKSRKSYAPPTSNFEKPKINARKSMLPKLVEGTKSESVFDRLYKPKYTKKSEPVISEAEKLRNNPTYIKKIVKNADLIYNLQKKDIKFPKRRSISAIHFKHISKSEMSNCIHKWASVSDKLDKIDSTEDIALQDIKVTSAVKSERKKVHFYTPGLSSINTPKPEELQSRLKSWLQKRGKSLSSYHHLQCFGLHHLKSDINIRTPSSISSTRFEDTVQAQAFDEENKENIALESDSDDGSYSEMMNEPKATPSNIDVTNWRNASMISESVCNESAESHNLYDVTLTPANVVENVDDRLYGALNDLSTLLREGYDWQEATRWLRSIRVRFPDAPNTAAYWECRAALEDARGNLNGSIDCWKEAVAKGTKASVADSNLEQLLTKFTQLELSPAPASAKLQDVRNVFTSSVIKFAVQEAKLNNNSKQATPPLFTVTPVRRSARLSRRVSRTPLQLCDTVRQAATIAPEHVFTPNQHLVHTP